jgi:hypothetical protein
MAFWETSGESTQGTLACHDARRALKEGITMPAVTPETPPLSVTEVSQRIRLQSLLLCKLAAHLCRTSVQLGVTARAIRQTSRTVWQHRALVAASRRRPCG